MPLVGSSRYTTVGDPMNAIAMDSFRFWPPDSPCAAMPLWSARPTSAAAVATAAAWSAAAMPLSAANSARWSRTVS